MIGPREAQVELLRRRARTGLLPFLRYCWWMPGPLCIGRHTRALCTCFTQAVWDLRAGKSTYIVVSLPFRHGKSDLVSRALPAFFLGVCADLQLNVMLTSYSASLVKGFSANVQNIVESEAYQHVFPGLSIDPDKNATDEWRIKDSVSSVYAQGLGGSITGKGANLIIVDDYCKNAEEAESQVQRDKVWESFKSDVSTRTNAPAHIIVVCATRWHVDDLIGRIYAEMDRNPEYPRYKSLIFPARKEGEDGWDTLFPELYNEGWYRFQRSQLGPYQAAALLDCDPKLSGATLFRRDWLQYYTGDLDLSKLKIQIFVDGAKAKSAGSDFTSIQAWGRSSDGHFYLLDGVHARLNLAEKIAALLEMGRRLGGPNRVSCIWWEQVGAMSDVESLRMEMNREMVHYVVRELHHNTNKDFRIKRLVVPLSNRQIWLPVRLLKTRTMEIGQGQMPIEQAYDFVKELVEDEMTPCCRPSAAPATSSARRSTPPNRPRAPSVRWRRGCRNAPP